MQYPFSFKEYVRYHLSEIKVDAKAFSMPERLLLQRALGDYLKTGGFPAVQALPPSRSVSVLQGYVQRVVALDVLERHGVGNARAVSGFARKLMALNGRQLSLRKVENELRSSGNPVSRAALSDYLAYFEEAFLVLPVKERLRSAAPAPNMLVKAYAVDPGLAHANAPASARDEGQSLEDAVCVELHRRLSTMRDDSVSSVTTSRHGYEVDFAAGDALFGDDLRFYQVTASLENPKTLERETRALWEALEEWSLKEAVIIVGDGQERVLEKDGRTIHCVAAWRWLLGG